MKSNHTQPSLPSDVAISETIADLTVSYTSCNYSWESFAPFFTWLMSCSDRDSFTLHLSVDGTASTINDTAKESEDQLRQHLVDMDGTEYQIDLTITKTVKNNTLSIYFLEKFNDFLTKNKISSTLQALSKIFQEFIFFETFDSKINFGSATVIFSHDVKDFIKSDEAILRRKQQQQSAKDNGISFDAPRGLLPEDFYIPSHTAAPKEISELFRKVCTVYSICYIANSSLIDFSNGNISFSISGYRTIEKTWNIHSEHLNADNVYRIYQWVYSESKSAEKLGLVRNIVSLNSGACCDDLFDDCSWNAIKSNYQIYLKDNIQQYLEIRSKISEAAIDTSSKAAELCNNFLDGFKSNAFGMASFLVGVIVVNGIKDNSSDKLFSVPYIAVALFMTIASALWLLISRKDALKKIDFISDNVKYSLDNSYGNIIIETEINELIDPVIRRNKDFTSEQIKIYTKFWLSILITFFLLFLIGGLYYETIPTPRNLISSNSISHSSFIINACDWIKSSSLFQMLRC